MGFRDLFRIAVAPPRPPVLPGQPLAAAGALPPRQVDAFVTPEALLSFSGMTAAITLLWGFIEAIGGLPHLLWVGAIIAGVCGFLLYLNDATNPQRAASPTRPMRIFAAVINSILLFNAASGSHDLAARAMAPPAAPSPLHAR
jgi:hypothetical protein